MADGKPSSNLGCVLALIAFPFVVLIGIVVGLVLRDDDGPSEESVTLDGGVTDGVSWQVDAVRDVDGQTCVFLFEEGAEDPLNGTCDRQPQDVTYGDQTVVFGRAGGDDDQVGVELSDGQVIDVETTATEGMEGRFYVTVIDGDLDAVALAP